MVPRALTTALAGRSADMDRFKTKRIGDGLYAIAGTDLLVSRDEKPRYGFPQEWSIVHKDRPHDPLLTGKGKADALERLCVIAEGLRRAAH